MNIYASINFLHRKLGVYQGATRLALLFRNQCNCVIAYHLGETADAHINGENWLTEIIAPTATTFIDVGANVGNWSDFFLSGMLNQSKQSKGLLFEPSLFAVSKLNQRFRHIENIEVIEAAVSDNVGEMPFFEEPNAGETSSLVGAHSNNQAKPTQVKVTTIDEEVAKRQLGFIDFLKVDTEGYDLHVLRGASALLKNHQVGIVQFEYNAPWALAGSTLAEAYKLLEGFDYKVFLLKSNGLHVLDYSRYGEFFSYSNFVAISPDKFPAMSKFVRGYV
jgi:FkbM family methyltransferase